MELGGQWGADEMMYIIRDHLTESVLETTKQCKNTTANKTQQCKISLPPSKEEIMYFLKNSESSLSLLYYDLLCSTVPGDWHIWR